MKTKTLHQVIEKFHTTEDIPNEPLIKHENLHKRKTSWNKKRDTKMKPNEPIIAFSQNLKKGVKRPSNSVSLLCKFLENFKNTV